jgi:hypothetical protein
VRPGPTPVVGVEPAILDEDRAGDFISSSRALLRAMRQTDVALVKRGEPPVGPAWIVIRKRVFYRPADLRLWIDEQAVPRGVVHFDKRLAPTPLDASGGLTRR